MEPVKLQTISEEIMVYLENNLTYCILSVLILGKLWNTGTYG
jgi:hypothetical protein